MTGRIVYHRVLNHETMELEERPEFFISGKVVTEAEFKAAFPDKDGVPAVPALKGYPIYSDALGVHPNRRLEHDELCKQKGVPTDTLRDGRVVLRDRAHRKAYLKAFGFHDRNSYDGH